MTDKKIKILHYPNANSLSLDESFIFGASSVSPKHKHVSMVVLAK